MLYCEWAFHLDWSPHRKFLMKARYNRSELGITAMKRKFVVVGTPEDQTFKDPHLLNHADTPDVADNFDIACETSTGQKIVQAIDYPVCCRRHHRSQIAAG